MSSCSNQLFSKPVNRIPTIDDCVNRCTHRRLSLKSKTCFFCIFRPNFPHYKEDVRITNSKMESFQKPDCGCDD